MMYWAASNTALRRISTRYSVLAEARCLIFSLEKAILAPIAVAYDGKGSLARFQSRVH